MKQVEVFVFSYNRWQFLQNCVKSAQRYVPNSSITIIDDHSDDISTQTLLQKLETEVAVRKPKQTDYRRWGGFYQNINWVIQELATAPWVVFIEDDMQFIRPIDKRDLMNISNYFEKYPNTACLSIDFFKAEHRERNELNVEIDRNNKIYFLKNAAKAYRGGIHFNSQTIVNIKRMREIGFVYENDRQLNRLNIEKSFDRMGIYAYPLSMYLPSPPTIKNKNQSIIRRFVEKHYKTGFYPYEKMSNEKLERFLKRDISILPYAEDWLKTSVPSPGPPFAYADSMNRVHGIIRRAEKVEYFIKRDLLRWK